jgi:hypothetical protein
MSAQHDMSQPASGTARDDASDLVPHSEGRLAAGGSVVVRTGDIRRLVGASVQRLIMPLPWPWVRFSPERPSVRPRWPLSTLRNSLKGANTARSRQPAQPPGAWTGGHRLAPHHRRVLRTNARVVALDVPL